MIKKTKLIGAFISTNVLLPFTFFSTSCSNKQKSESVTSSNYSENSNADSNKITISEEIKNSIKKGFSPNENEDQSILIIKDLVNAADSRTQKSEADKIETFLNQLASKLNKNNDESKIELKGNKIVEDALKKIIYDNCKATSELLRTKFSIEFGEVASDKILEIDENGLFFNLKNFGIDKILHEIGYKNDNERKIEIADSQALKIYKFNTDLKIIVNTSSGKKAQVPISDLNLFIVSNKEQVMLLQEGIANYLKEKFERKVVSLYLDGNEPKVKSDSEANEHFTEILKKKNYNLTDNENNRNQAMSYLTNKYLPKLIYQNRTKDTSTDEEKIPLKIDSKNLTFDSGKDNFLKDGMEMPEPLRQKINFEKFFGNNQNARQINDATVKEIESEHFLKHKAIHEGKYYSLGTGTLNVNQWSIRGFQIRPIDVKFEIFINCEILRKEIRNLHTCLNNVLDIMKKSSVIKIVDENNKQEYVLRIIVPRIEARSRTILNKINEKGMTYDKILDFIYLEEARQKSIQNFSPAIFKEISFEFLVKFLNREDKLLVDRRTWNGGNSYPDWKFNRDGIDVTRDLKGPIEIYFIFNSFKIKLTDEQLVSKLDNREVNRIES